MKSQTKDIKRYLETHKRGITSLQAFEMFGATRLSSIIYRLRREGMNIETETALVKNRYGGTSNIAIYKAI